MGSCLPLLNVDRDFIYLSKRVKKDGCTVEDCSGAGIQPSYTVNTQRTPVIEAAPTLQIPCKATRIRMSVDPQDGSAERVMSTPSVAGEFKGRMKEKGRGLGGC